MRGLACFSMMGCLACTAPNPAYQAEDTGEAGPGETGPGETGPSDATTAVETTAVATTASASTGAESSGGVVDCEPHAPLPLAIEVSDDRALIMPDCVANEVLWLDAGNNAFPLRPSGRIVHAQCDDPVCPCTSNTVFTIDLGEDVAFARDVPIPGCGRLAVWPAMGPDGECVWGGVILYKEDDVVPEYIAARTLEVPPLDLALELREDSPCPEDGGCMRAPGRYALGLFEHTITAEQAPPYIVVAFLMDGDSRTYLFDNRMSSITPDCQPQVAWTAQRVP